MLWEEMVSPLDLRSRKLSVPSAPVMIVPADIETIVEVFIVLVDMREARKRKLRFFGGLVAKFGIKTDRKAQLTK